MKCVEREECFGVRLVVRDLRYKVVYVDFGLLVHSAVYIGILISAFWRSLLPPSSWYFSPESGSKTLRYIYIYIPIYAASYSKRPKSVSAFLSFVLLPQIRDGQGTSMYHIWQE